MGATKHLAYSQKQIETADLFKALAHPARVAVLENLMDASDQDATIDELFRGINIAQSTKSRHLHVMTSAGILKSQWSNENRRSFIRYKLNHVAMIEIVKVVKALMKQVDNQKTGTNKFPKDGFFVKLVNMYNWGTENHT